MARLSGIPAIDAGFVRLPAASGADPVKRVLGWMDSTGIERAGLEVDADATDAQRALRLHPERFFAACRVDPSRGMDEVRRVVVLHGTWGVRALTASPAALVPQVPLDDGRFYPLYAKCVELGLAFCCDVGIPEARVPLACQKPGRVDAVCAFFPELRFVMRGSPAPWTALAARLLLRWPGLHWSSEGLAPRDRGAVVRALAEAGAEHKLVYGGAPAAGPPGAVLPALARLPLPASARRAFLRDNALRAFALGP